MNHLKQRVNYNEERDIKKRDIKKQLRNAAKNRSKGSKTCRCPLLAPLGYFMVVCGRLKDCTSLGFGNPKIKNDDFTFLEIAYVVLAFLLLLAIGVTIVAYFMCTLAIYFPALSGIQVHHGSLSNFVIEGTNEITVSEDGSNLGLMESHQGCLDNFESDDDTNDKANDKAAITSALLDKKQQDDITEECNKLLLEGELAKLITNFEYVRECSMTFNKTELENCSYLKSDMGRVDGNGEFFVPVQPVQVEEGHDELGYNDVPSDQNDKKLLKLDLDLRHPPLSLDQTFLDELQLCLRKHRHGEIFIPVQVKGDTNEENYVKWKLDLDLRSPPQSLDQTFLDDLQFYLPNYRVEDKMCPVVTEVILDEVGDHGGCTEDELAHVFEGLEYLTEPPIFCEKSPRIVVTYACHRIRHVSISGKCEERNLKVKSAPVSVPSGADQHQSSSSQTRQGEQPTSGCSYRAETCGGETCSAGGGGGACGGGGGDDEGGGDGRKRGDGKDKPDPLNPSSSEERRKLRELHKQACAILKAFCCSNDYCGFMIHDERLDLIPHPDGTCLICSSRHCFASDVDEADVVKIIPPHHIRQALLNLWDLIAQRSSDIQKMSHAILEIRRCLQCYICLDCLVNDQIVVVCKAGHTMCIRCKDRMDLCGHCRNFEFKWINWPKNIFQAFKGNANDRRTSRPSQTDDDDDFQHASIPPDDEYLPVSFDETSKIGFLRSEIDDLQISDGSSRGLNTPPNPPIGYSDASCVSPENLNNLPDDGLGDLLFKTTQGNHRSDMENDCVDGVGGAVGGADSQLTTADTNAKAHQSFLTDIVGLPPSDNYRPPRIHKKDSDLSTGVATAERSDTPETPERLMGASGESNRVNVPAKDGAEQEVGRLETDSAVAAPDEDVDEL